MLWQTATITRRRPASFRAQHVREQSPRTGHPGGKLAEPAHGGEDVNALAVARPELAAGQRLLTGVVRGEHRAIVRIPLRSEVEAALLHPALEILGVDVVRILHQRA